MRRKHFGKYNDRDVEDAVAAEAEDLGEPSVVILSKNRAACQDTGAPPVAIGDRIQFVPSFSHTKDHRPSAFNAFVNQPVTAEVVAINPRGRFYRVRFALVDGSPAFESIKY